MSTPAAVPTGSRGLWTRWSLLCGLASGVLAAAVVYLVGVLPPLAMILAVLALVLGVFELVKSHGSATTAGLSVAGMALGLAVIVYALVTS